jgi:hypothetical protein
MPVEFAPNVVWVYGANRWFLVTKGSLQRRPSNPIGRHCPGRVIGGQLLSSGLACKTVPSTSHELLLATQARNSEIGPRAPIAGVS